MTSSAASGAKGHEESGADRDLEITKLYLEMWKQTVTVQQHFNDLELRIRSLALTALTFTLGAAGVAAKDGFRVNYRGVDIGAGSAIAGAGLLLWGAFWFVDRIWYHRLLIGSVTHGTALEQELAKSLPLAGLTQAISASSPSVFRLWGPKRRAVFTLRSSRKLSVFYIIGAIPLMLVGLLLWSATPRPSVPTSGSTPSVITTATSAPTKGR